MNKRLARTAGRCIGLLFAAAAFFALSIPGVSADEQDLNSLLVTYSGDRFIMSQEFDVEERKQITQNTELWMLPEEADIKDVQRQLEEEPGVLYAEPDYERKLSALTNDPYVSEQWWIPHIRSESIWRFAPQQKKSIVVAVIDSGVSKAHEDLQGRIHLQGYNFYDDNANAEDVHGHGTNVAGVIAAASNNGIGITGAAGMYDIKVLPLRVTDAKGSSRVSDIVRAIDYAVSKHADVINLSIGSPQFSKPENEAVQRAVEAGVTVVASAGNDAQKGNYINYPASYEHVISTAAVDSKNNRASFSNYNEHVSITAPGVRIYTTARKGYAAVNGTSFSAPIVAGAAAVAKSLDPDLTPAEMKELLGSTATDLGPPGKDSYFGAGLLNMENLQRAIMKEADPAFIGDFPDRMVSADKEFVVTFSQNLRTGKDYSSDIHIVNAGIEASFTASVDRSQPNKLRIRPLSQWKEGMHYMTISKQLENAEGTALKKEVTMRFDVAE